MDGDRRRPPAAAAASAAAVLGDDDLLREILLRLGFPTTLVLAALVSKRWLSHASDPAFLRLFRERNPPRLLGACVGYPGRYRFLPLPEQAPELAAPVRRATSSCDAAFALRSPRVKHCRSGGLIVEVFKDGRFNYPLMVPLLSGESAAVLPRFRLSHHNYWEGRTQTGFAEMFLPEDGGRDGITAVNLRKDRRRVRAEVCVMEGSGGWGVPANAVTEMELPNDTVFVEVLPPVHGKVFMVTNSGYALGLDLAAASFFTLELPARVRSNYMLSCAEGSGIYLVTADGFQLSVWLHRMSSDSDVAGWLLMSRFFVDESDLCTRRIENEIWVPRGNCLDVVAVGDNADFVFLDHAESGVLFYVNLRTRMVQKVCQRSADECGIKRTVAGHVHVSPVMMIWPPIFPAQKVGHDQKE